MTRLFVGTYARRGGRGLYPLREGADGWQVDPPLSQIQNASGGVANAEYGVWYLVNETAEGSVTAYQPAPHGWREVARATSAGAEPCYAAIDRTGCWLAVANYGSGSVALYALDRRTGAPTGPPFTHQLSGDGPNKDRQEGPHAHWVGFDPQDNGLYVTDLGADTITRLTPYAGGLAAEVVFRAPPGSGPRLLLFHPKLPIAYLMSELASTVTVFERPSGGRLRVRQRLSTLPTDCAVENLGGHIIINAACDRLYVTNRGHDSVAVFAVDADGDLSLMQHSPAGGTSPRFLHLLEAQDQLTVANEESGSVCFLKLQEDGTLCPPHQTVKAPGAVFILEA
jgi:6-phosphogluconolactonase